MTQEYKIHKHQEQNSTIFIKGNGIFGHYMVHNNDVSKIFQLDNGDESISPFHTIGDLPTNSEAKLLNELRLKGEI